MTTEPWASVEDVAKHLGVGMDSVYRRLDARNMPTHKIGRLWKRKLSEVDEEVRLVMLTCTMNGPTITGASDDCGDD